MVVVDFFGSFFVFEFVEFYFDVKVIVFNCDFDVWFQFCCKVWFFCFLFVSFIILNWLFYWDKKVLRIWMYFFKLYGVVWCFEWFDEDVEIKVKVFFERYYVECCEWIFVERCIEYFVQEGWGLLCCYFDVLILIVRVFDSDEIVELLFFRYVQYCLVRVQRYRLICVVRLNDVVSFQKYQNNIIISLLKGGMYVWIGRILFIVVIV